MAEITFAERRNLEELFDMEAGYVLDFSNRTFENFVFEATHKRIYDERFSGLGTSKANRLRAFWEVESPTAVGALLNALIDYASELRPPTATTQSSRDKCIAIAKRLEASTITRSDPAPKPSKDFQSDFGEAPPDVPADYFEALCRRGFRLEKLLGQGLSGRVFQAKQSDLGRSTAIKFFDNKLSTRYPFSEPRRPKPALSRRDHRRLAKWVGFEPRDDVWFPARLSPAHRRQVEHSMLGPVIHKTKNIS